MSKQIIDYPAITEASDDYYVVIQNAKTRAKHKLCVNNLTPAGTDLIGTSADWNVSKIERNVSVNWVNGEIVVDWNGGSNNSGFNLYKAVKIPASANKIKFKITTGSNGGTDTGSYDLVIGLRSSTSSGWVFRTTSGWITYQYWNSTTYDHSVLEGELDLSSIHSDNYLYICGVFWDLTVNKLEMF